MKNLKQLSLALLALVVFTACSNDDDSTNPEPVNEEEVITTLTATLTPVGGSEAITLEYRDLDGDGPDAPVYDISSPLALNTTYNGTLVLLNETVSPAELINEEIEEESNDHQFFYSTSNDMATFTYLDVDGNGDPLGLAFTLTTVDADTEGDLTIILRHEPSKSADGVAGGDITNAGGATDVIAIFPIEIQ
ncbi:type 1 periplasmic binding fold superfamily protein [Psychroserpens sp. NJDZ02]|uniref:type 1 periplasmic binding fold superfamily protein n=1 Tax=Psychroserpens sp. NJDZ02 TaxID=2570561 RepID=UPI0010A7B084|nr:type 1 periplasmic binding fold superfamily protein [Psychroserpens sp. NJDZ02]QCE42797.1 type 1 periplasmic binding fold superfamily protein [Psychroserpens sp. NJDZ02]